MSINLFNNLFKFLRNAEGATAVEYSLIAALIGLALLAALGGLGNVLAQLFGSVAIDIGSTATP